MVCFECSGFYTLHLNSFSSASSLMFDSSSVSLRIIKNLSLRSVRNIFSDFTVFFFKEDHYLPACFIIKLMEKIQDTRQK